ncbi:MAG: SDR family oxidoreductase [Alphaproteobacteria bacterium]|nr:MAG: SDR family oxidoreductase [Alphaproteobacteria bacterium]
MTRIMLITGASRGIGAATARLAGAQDYAVCVNYLRSADAAADIVRDIERAGGRAVAVQADISKPAEVVRLFEACDRELGRLDVLVNNAGVLEGQRRLDVMDAARIDRVFATNVRGAFLCAGEAVKRMSTRHGGRGGAIVNLSSRAALLGSPNEFIDYAASKGAIDTMTIGLAREVAGEGIRVNAVRPGLITTDIHADSKIPDRLERLTPGVPMQRPGTPEEVARAILWLASDEASYTTGAFLDIGGGR